MSTITTVHAASRLTPAEVSHYEKDGYVLFKQPVFSPEKFAQLQAIFE